MNPDRLMDRYRVEHEQKWREEQEHIPFIQFPADWQVQIIPPFGDAAVRFRVRLPSDRIKSVYLDVRESLGYYGEPYWEVYPYRGDTGRCARADLMTLLNMIADEEKGDDT